MNDIPWWHKALIGAIGGLALALLKLIEAKFYLSSNSVVEAYAAYLTYSCYLVLGSIAAVFLSDHELTAPKVRRSAFVLGLLAPSVLLALANQPFKTGSIEQAYPTVTVPSLSWIPVSTAEAQGVLPKDQPMLEATNEIRVMVISKKSLEPSFGAAISAALGRSTLIQPYTYVVGSTDEEDKALETARKISTILSVDSSKNTKYTPQVIQIAGNKKYFVTIGGFAPRANLMEAKSDTTGALLKALGSDSNLKRFSAIERKSLADLLADAPIVPARQLFTIP